MPLNWLYLLSLNLNARDAARAVYDMLSTENELRQPKEPDITKARALLYETHGDGTQVRQRTVSLLTSDMKHRQQGNGHGLSPR